MRLIQYTYPNYRAFAPAAIGLENEISRLLSSAACGFNGDGRIPVALSEDQANAYVRAELPGVNRDDIQVELTDGTLTLTAARKTPVTEDQPEQSASFSRSLSIPAEVSADQVSATYENGVLTVTLPKREEAKPKKITVAVK